MNKKTFSIIIVAIWVVSLIAVAVFFSKGFSGITGNVVYDNKQEEAIDLSSDSVDTSDIEQVEIVKPENNPTSNFNPTSSTGNRRRSSGGGGSSSGSSSGGSSSSSSSSNDDSDIELLNILKNSGKTKSEIPPPAIPI